MGEHIADFCHNLNRTAFQFLFLDCRWDDCEHQSNEKKADGRPAISIAYPIVSSVFRWRSQLMQMKMMMHIEIRNIADGIQSLVLPPDGYSFFCLLYSRYSLLLFAIVISSNLFQGT